MKDNFCALSVSLFKAEYALIGFGPASLIQRETPGSTSPQRL